MKCFSCKGIMDASTTTYMTTHKDCYIIIKNVPCQKCSQCGEEFLNGETLLKIEEIFDKLKSMLTEIAVVDFKTAREEYTMNERIRILRKEYLHMTLEQFGQRLGVSKVAISRIENGINSVTDQMFKAICREFHVNEDWLRTGTGNWEISTPDSTIEKLRQEYNLTDLEYSLISEYFKLNEKDRDAFREYLKNVLQSMENQEHASSSSEDLYTCLPKTAEELEQMYPPVEDTESNAG